jgi:hypothetical protein
MFDRLAALVSRIRPRPQTLTEDELHTLEARLQASQERNHNDDDWYKAAGSVGPIDPPGIGVGGGF